MPTSSADHPTKPLHQFTARELIRAIGAGETTCAEVAQACLEHIAKREPSVQAWHYLSPDRVLAHARSLDAVGVRGPLHGVPLGIKDIIDTYDMPSEYGSPIYAGHQPRADAACVALSRKAGGLVFGKTVTTEFANRHPGKTRHPLAPERTPGGSSSGSAAAVADHMVPLALGTQTAASTIRPASFCGVFGYRPSLGDVSCVGVKDVARSLDTVGLFARSLEDIQLYREVLLGIAPEPSPMARRAAPRIGFCRTPLWFRVEPYTQQLLERAARQLSTTGATVTEVDLPDEFEGIEDAHRWIFSFEFARSLTWEIEHHWNDISETLRSGRLQDGLACSFERYRQARDLTRICRRELERVFADYDVILTAAATGEAPIGLESTGDASPCVIWTTMGVPAVTIPVFTGLHGLPIGAQVVGRRNADRELFEVASWIHERLG